MTSHIEIQNLPPEQETTTPTPKSQRIFTVPVGRYTGQIIEAEKRYGRSSGTPYIRIRVQHKGSSLTQIGTIGRLEYSNLWKLVHKRVPKDYEEAEDITWLDGLVVHFTVKHVHHPARPGEYFADMRAFRPVAQQTDAEEALVVNADTH